MRDIGSKDWACANLPIVVAAAFAFALSAGWPDGYALISQEDHWVEWSTVWAFALAAVFYAWAARNHARIHSRVPWFYAALAAGCFFIAMEEMSWGQRLFSYRPPAYFLQDNFQQELNLHNVVDSSYRKWALQTLILGYGVLLPLAFALPWLRRLQVWLGVIPSPIQLIPAFAATSAMYFIYPLELTGEWVELMLGLCMLIAAALGATGLHAQRFGRPPPGALYSLIPKTTLVLALGAATVWFTGIVQAGSPEVIAKAQAEVSALAQDFRHERVATRCGVHKRIYTFMREYGQRYLSEGVFASRQWDDADVGRGEFFLDPWNMPYWVRHVCSADRSSQFVFVYSFGPNRRRDSNAWEIKPDDIGLATESPQTAR